LYPEKTVVGIDSSNMLANGGMVHCITQQQPQFLSTVGLQETTKMSIGKLERIIDILSREVIDPKENILYFYIYENGIVEKKALE
jgi:hypothetical protein